MKQNPQDFRVRDKLMRDALLSCSPAQQGGTLTPSFLCLRISEDNM